MSVIIARRLRLARLRTCRVSCVVENNTKDKSLFIVSLKHIAINRSPYYWYFQWYHQAKWLLLYNLMKLRLV